MSELDRLRNTLHAHGTSHQLITAGAMGDAGIRISLFKFPNTSVTITFLHRPNDGHLDVLDSEAGLLAQKVKAGDAYRAFARSRKELA